MLVVSLCGMLAAIGLAQETEEPSGVSTGGTLIDGRNEAERALALLRFQATTRPHDPNYPKYAISKYVARLITGTDTDYAVHAFESAALQTVEKLKTGKTSQSVKAHGLDPFDKHALMHAWLLCHDQLTSATTTAIREYMTLWHHRIFTGYGAMNYRLMMDGSGFIAAEQWPDLVDADGLKSDEIKAATKQRLLGYFNDIVHRNFAEYEAPTYYGVDLAAIKMLADYAQDPVVKKRAALTLDWMMVNVACSWNQGYNIASAGRAKYWGSTNTSPEGMDSTAGIGWIYFGGNRPVNGAGTNDSMSIWFAVPRDYHPPGILAEIAQDRASPFTHHGTVWLDSKNEVKLTIFQSRSYGLASQWEFLSGPTHGLYKETRRQMLKWISDRPASTFCPMQDNPRRPYLLKENVANTWGYGENPFGQSLQHEGTLIGLCSVPEDYPYYKLYAPFSQSGSIVKRIEKEGWIFCHAGSMLFGFRTVKPYTWGKPEQGNDVIWSDARKNGWLLETSELAPYAGGGMDAELDRFAGAILTKTKTDVTQIDAEKPRLSFKSLSGHVLEIAFRPHGQPLGESQKVDGHPVDYAGYPLLGNPWVTQALNGDELVLRHAGKTVHYDFKNW